MSAIQVKPRLIFRFHNRKLAPKTNSSDLWLSVVLISSRRSHQSITSHQAVALFSPDWMPKNQPETFAETGEK